MRQNGQVPVQLCLRNSERSRCQSGGATHWLHVKRGSHIAAEVARGAECRKLPTACGWCESQ